MVASTSTTGSCSGKAPLPASAEPPQAATLHAELRRLMASRRQRLAGAVNAELTRLGEQLAQAFGRGFEAKNLRRMVQFAQAFPQPEIVTTLSRPLSGSHFVSLLPLKTEPARQFYARQAATNTWSVRGLRHPIDRKAFERTELAALQANSPVQAELVEAANTAPAQVFKDPYFLDFLVLRQGHDEADLEAAILRPLEAFNLELGRVPASSCAPNPAANRWSCCKCTKTASPWPNTGLNCHPKRSWSKSCMQRCLNRVSGWRGVGCCWGTWMTSDDHGGQQRLGVHHDGTARRRVHVGQGRKRAIGRGGVLCGCDAGYAKVGANDEWHKRFWQEIGAMTSR